MAGPLSARAQDKMSGTYITYFMKSSTHCSRVGCTTDNKLFSKKLKERSSMEHGHNHTKVIAPAGMSTGKQTARYEKTI